MSGYVEEPARPAGGPRQYACTEHGRPYEGWPLGFALACEACNDAAAEELSWAKMNAYWRGASFLRGHWHALSQQERVSMALCVELLEQIASNQVKLVPSLASETMEVPHGT